MLYNFQPMNYTEIAIKKQKEIESLTQVPNIEINHLIDFTLLRPDATYEELRNFVKTAEEKKYYAICINPYFVPMAKELISNEIKLCSVVGFPLGALPLNLKLYEVYWLIEQNVDEIDFVINISEVKSKNYKYVEKEISEISRTFPNSKVIIETCLLTDEEKIEVSKIVRNSNAKFVKTSTGFSKHGATFYDVALIRAVVGDNFGVKASGGIRDRETAIKMILSGANRIGTSSII